jgi:hypothetical protein
MQTPSHPEHRAAKSTRRAFLRSAVAAGALGSLETATWSARARTLNSTSRLWGVDGELWDPAGRLPDFSFAGYHQGKRKIPDVPTVANVREFGAAGDGRQDDTGAFVRAIEKTAGVDMCFDHHKRAPFANLFTDIDLGAGTRMYQSGGGADLRLHSAAWTTFWNVRAERPQRWPRRSFGPDLMNLVAVTTREPQVIEPNGKWLEVIDPQAIRPQNLHHAQLERRLRQNKAN